MNVVDLHPEDLLDRHARGELSPAEADRLERHLAQCESCRLEHQARTHFRSEEDVDGEEFDVQRLLSEVLAPGAERMFSREHSLEGQQLRAPPQRRSIGRRMHPLLFIAAALLVAGVSAAAGWKGLSAIQARSSELVMVAGDTPPPTTAHVRPRSAAVNTPLVTSSAPLAVAPLADPPPPVLAATPLVGPLVAPSAPFPAAARAGTVPGSPVAVRSAPPTWTAPSVSVTMEPASGTEPVVGAAADAPALFERANRARRAGDHDRAATLYRSLIDHYPSSPEAHESQAVLGRALLGDGDASGAVRCFDEYLRAGGSVGEDVMADRALALGRLGRAHDEAEAWRRLLGSYPSSVHTERAHARLRELGDL